MIADAVLPNIKYAVIEAYHVPSQSGIYLRLHKKKHGFRSNILSVREAEK